MWGGKPIFLKKILPLFKLICGAGHHLFVKKIGRLFKEYGVTGTTYFYQRFLMST
jgi:hypothetical protein